MTQPTGTILTGLISINGQRVTYCTHECATHKCVQPCGRIVTHPADQFSHICDGCAELMAGVFS